MISTRRSRNAASLAFFVGRCEKAIHSQMAHAASFMGPVVEPSNLPNPASTFHTLAVPRETVTMKNPVDPYAPLRAQISKPLKIVENVFGPAVRIDPKGRDDGVAASLKPQTFGRTQMNTGSLPYSTTPRLRNPPLDRPVPVDTRVPQGEWNEAVARAGPFYARHWQIWEHAPYLPSRGDVSLDPRYINQPRPPATIRHRTKGV